MHNILWWKQIIPITVIILQEPTSPSSPPVKLLKVQAAPKIPVQIVEEDNEDQDKVQIDELRTLEEKVNKARHEYERSQEVLDAYKTEHNVKVEGDKEEEEAQYQTGARD